MSNASLNSSRGLSGITALNYSSDFPSSEPHGGGLMPPPLMKKVRMRLAPAAANNRDEDVLHTPTFGQMPKYVTGKFQDMISVRMKLDMSSPSLFVMSPMVQDKEQQQQRPALEIPSNASTAERNNGRQKRVKGA